MDNHPHTTEEYLVIACRQYAESHKDQFMPRATLWQAADTIERLQKENDRLRQPRCINEPAGDPCKFCGAREDTDVCRDGTDHIIRERDAALAEVERLKARLDIIPVATGSPRCKLCGVLLSGDLEKQFCSTCCAQ